MSRQIAMPPSEFELKKCEKAIAAFLKKSRPPPHIRKELDLGYRINGHSIEIFEIRPKWRNPENTLEIPVAKSTNVSVFWMTVLVNCGGFVWSTTSTGVAALRSFIGNVLK